MNYLIILLFLLAGCAKQSTGPQGSAGPVGAQGVQGAPGPVPDLTPVSVIEPCGHNSSAYKEVLLGLEGGQVFGSFSSTTSALTVRNTLIPDGSFYDTDDSQCYFTVSTDSQGNRSVVWNGTSNSGNTYPSGASNYNIRTKTWE